MIPGSARLFGGDAPGLFVAVADTDVAAGLVMTSPDGLIWTSRTASQAAAFSAVAWSPTLKMYCAVGSGGVVMTSTNGTTWSNQTGASASTWRGIAWSTALGLFVVTGTGAGASTDCMTSPDGITWTNRTMPSHRLFNGVCAIATAGWAGGRRVATVSDDGGLSIRSSYSNNGTAWSDFTAFTSSSSYPCIIFAPEKSSLVALGFAPVTGQYTTDGTWNAAAGLPAMTYRAMAYSPVLQRIVAVSSTIVANQNAYSNDGGQNWTGVNAASATIAYYGVAWSPFLHLFVAITPTGTAGHFTQYSSDGITWNVGNTPTPSCDRTWKSICWGNP